MPDDTNKRGPQDSSRINIHEEWEFNYCTEKLGVSKHKLIEAVQAVGTSLDAVKGYLKK